MIDTKPVLFTVSTINDSLPTVSNSILCRDQDLAINEDDWRQFEALSQNYDEAISAELTDIRRIYKEKSKPVREYHLFTEIHVRKRIPDPFPRPLSWTDFLSACEVSDMAAANVSFSGSQGVIDGGFAIRAGEITFYGIRDLQGIRNLCLVPTRRPNLSREQAQHISEYLSIQGLVLIHWPTASVLREKEVISYFEQK